MPYKVGVTTGLYSVSKADELATTTRKLDYALTRGTSAIEIAGDVAHEVTQTEGRQIRYTAQKQGLEILWHGPLTIPLCIPERSEWRDAQERMTKAVRSAVYAGAKYVNFHACSNIWLELMTYAGRKLSMVFCDHQGNFIGKILRENKDLRNWFVQSRWQEYLHDILSREETIQVTARSNAESDSLRKEQISKQLRAASIPEEIINYIETRRTIPQPPVISRQMHTRITQIIDAVTEEFSIISADLEQRYVKQAMLKKLSKGKRWHSEQLRGVVGVVDGYHIMAHWMFYTKDKVWKKMAEMYKDVLDKYKMNYRDKEWLDKAWHTAEQNNDRDFKEFYYAVVAAKFLAGHMEKLEKWLNDEFIKNELATIRDSNERKHLIAIAKNLKFTIETPDARDPAHAGLYLFWHPKQIYAAIKIIRETQKNDRVWMLQDWEHLATQGLDPIEEAKQLVKIAPDAGEITLAVHANAPNPMHGHLPLELGDVRIYQLLYYMRKTGFGKKTKAYVIYERGGDEDPYQQSVVVLRLAVKFLEQDIHPDELPEEYFGMKGPVAGDFERQKQIIQQHAWEPLKDMLETPDQEWTFLSQAAMKKGKKPETWKKSEFR